MAGRVGKVALGAAVVAAAVAAVRALRGGPTPAFSGHPSAGPPTPAPAPAPAPVTAEAATPEPSGAAEPTTGPEPRTGSAAGEASAAAASTGAETETAAEPEGSWVEPVDGGCPDGFPVKAKLSSGIFHVPGGLAYERTRPDRCYRSAADAEADGLRAAKR
jgi:hypothetical protein